MDSNKLIGAGLLTAGMGLLGNLVAVLSTPGVITGTSAQILNITFVVEGFITLTSIMLLAIVSLDARMKKLDKKVDSLSEIVGRFFTSIGAELLAITTGILASFIQEGIFPDRFSKIEKISSIIIVSVILGLSAHLISQRKRYIKILGAIFYLSPIPLFIFLTDTNLPELLESVKTVSYNQAYLMIGALISLILLLVLALLRKRDSFK